jgi:hypothetical protein
MSRHHSYAQAIEPPLAASGWGPWSEEAMETAEGPGLLVSRAFWIGGGLSVLLWTGVTLLALQWL